MMKQEFHNRSSASVTTRTNVKNLTHHIHSGRTMVEMLGVLAIIGVLSVGAIAGYSKAMNKHKINKTINQMTQIINNIRNVYVNKHDYSGLNNIEAVNLGVFPTEMVTDPTTGKVKNLYQGDVTVSGTTENFDVFFEGLPRDVSTQLAVTDWGVNDSDLIQIKLNISIDN